MARAAFSDEALVKSLADQHYIPVLVDGDTEKDVLQKFGVGGFPTLKFMDSKGTVTGQMGQRSADALIRSAEAAAKKAGSRFSKAYMTLVKADAKLQKAMAKEKYKDALKAIKSIEGVGREGSHSMKAAKIKTEIEETAQKRFEEAKSLIESKPGKAKGQLKKISKEFAGLDVAAEAKKLAATIE